MRPNIAETKPKTWRSEREGAPPNAEEEAEMNRSSRPDHLSPDIGLAVSCVEKAECPNQFASEPKVEEENVIATNIPQGDLVETEQPIGKADCQGKAVSTGSEFEKIEWEKPSWTKEPNLHTASDTSAAAKVFEWEKPNWVKPKLRATSEGEAVKKGNDLQNPITHVQKDNMDDINFHANPMVLKPTLKGSSVRLGDNLALPITNIKEVMDDNGDNVDRDVNLVAKPSNLKPTEVGATLKEKGDLQNPITHVEKDNLDDINFEANPMILKPTEKGKEARLGDNLARPITFIRGK